MDLNILLLIIVIVTILWALVLQVQIFLMKKKFDYFFGSKGNTEIQTLLNDYVSKIKAHIKDIEDLKDFTLSLYKMGEKCIQKIAVIRYNPFQEVGGNQSFSIALLDYNNNGFIISSLFGREGVRVYSKPVTKGESEFHLTQEEKDVMQKAMKNSSKILTKKKIAIKQ